MFCREILEVFSNSIFGLSYFLTKWLPSLQKKLGTIILISDCLWNGILFLTLWTSAIERENVN